MSVTFKEFTERIANEYTQLNLLEKRINQFFNAFRINFEAQPASQLMIFLKDQCGQFKVDKEKLVVKQTELDKLQTKYVDQPDPVARERRRELYAKLDFLDSKLARLVNIQLGGLKTELEEHFKSTISFLDKWYSEALSTIVLWTETIDGLPIAKRYEFFEWIQSMFNQLQRTCMHYEELLDDLSCEAHNTSHKRKHRAGLETLKTNLKTISTTALKSKTNNNNNTQQQPLHTVDNIYKHLGVSVLQGEDYTLTPIKSNDSLHVHLSNLIQASNSSNLPSFYGLIAGKPSRIVQLVQAFSVVNTKRENAFCVARDQVQAKNSRDFNSDAIQHLKNHPARAGMIDSINTWLFFGGNWANIYRAMETEVPLLPTRFGSAAIMLDTAEATNEYVPCMKCNAGDILTDSLCACTKQEEYIPLLLCCAMLGNIYLAKRANNDGEEFDQARNHFDSLLIEELSFGGQGRRRNFVVFNSDLVFAKYLFNKQELIDIAGKILNIPPDRSDDLICLYQWGSHLFGTNGPNSDYDLVAVVRGYNYGVLKGQTDHAPDWQLVADAHTKLVSKAEINGVHFDVVCFEEKYWQHLIRQNIIWIYVFETLGGEEHPKVLVKRKNFEVSIRWQMMHYQALIDFSKNEKYMKMFWVKQSKYNKTKKKIIYILQHLEFAIQVFERGTIYDLTAGNKYREELMPMDFHGDFSLIEAWYKPKKEKLFEKLDAICYSYRSFEPKVKTTKEVLKFMEYVRSIGIENLTKILSVHCIPCSKEFQELVQLLPSKKETPWDKSWLRTCTGLIINKDTLDIISYPMDNISKDTELLRPNIKFDKKISVTAKLDGVQIQLYCYKNQWLATAFNFIDRYSSERCHKCVDLFWTIFNERNYSLPNNTSICYVFELVGPYDYVNYILEYNEPDLFLIAARDMTTLDEVSIEDIPWKKLPNLASDEPLRSTVLNGKQNFFALEQYAADLKLLAQSGLVVCDSQYNRTQVLHTGYESMQILVNGYYDMYSQITVKTLVLKIIRSMDSGDITRFKQKFTKFGSVFEEVLQLFEEFCVKMDNYYHSLDLYKELKELDSVVKKNPFRPIFFTMRRENITAKQILTSAGTITPHKLSENVEKAVLLGQFSDELAVAQ